MPETVTGVLFTQEEVDVIGRVLSRGLGVLNKDEKDRDPAGRFLNRVAPNWHGGGMSRPGREPLYRADLWGLHFVLVELRARWLLKTTARYWREVGAPGGEAAIKGLAAEFRQAADDALVALRVVGPAWAMASPLPTSWREEAA